ncbi:hypothetical protein B0A50_03066 [Salinomyces thailandicus]|uniref:HTH La-type RNA-binding domain-containing protein n=1 Tax=Salinomyces thailandicus TaxID=706561 RepID=A0A4U0U1L3_9PEZI|nr:hypothetical protein B0A50_03066 [Salinomyces thailandica]
MTDITTGGNWADDVEASAAEKPAESQKASGAGKQAAAKDSGVERAKSEEKTQNVASGVSSPDLTCSASTTTKDDDSSTAPTNGSSETTWETKSQASEPAWIAERKERQSSSQNSDNTVKGSKKSKDTSAQPPPKPVVLQEAAVPTVNPWMQRKEALSAKATAPQHVAKVAPAPSTTPSNASKENQAPRADPKRKANSVAALPRQGESASSTVTDSKKPTGVQGKRANEVRITQSATKPTAGDSSPNVGRPAAPTRSSLPNPTVTPPVVKDETSWPTVDTAQAKERKETADKESPKKNDKSVDETPSSKQSRKKEWQAMNITPNIIWETPNVRGRDAPRGGPAGGRGNVRGRGGFRGGANGGGGADRPSGKAGESEASPAATQQARTNLADRVAMPPPPKPDRAASESSRREQQTESRVERSTRGQSVTEQSAGLEDVKATTSPSEQTESQPPSTVSSGKVDGSASASKESDMIRVPLRGPAAKQIGANGEQAQNAAQETPPARVTTSDARKESRPYENGFKDNGFTGPARGGKRSGRGRGGSREFANGHQAAHAYTNGEYSGAGFGVPPSPSFAGPRGNHQFGYPAHGRGGFSRGNPRSQSNPMEGFYGRSFQSAYTSPALPHLQGYMPGMYEYGYPMSAVPYQPVFDQQYLMDMLSTQLEYYFSIDNLLKDMYLRRNMDSQGFVFLDFVGGFNRLKQLTQDKDLLKAVCLNSTSIEIRVGEDGKERLRRRDGWDQFLLPMEQREPGAQNEGPKELQRPEKPQLPAFGPSPARGPQSAALPGMHPRFDRRSYDAGHASYDGMAPYGAFPAVAEAFADMMGGEDMRGRTTKSPLRDNEMSPFQQARVQDEKDLEPDAFPEDQIGALTVVVKVNRPQPPFHTAATRTFSNGSIDSRTIFGEIDRAEKPGESQAAPLTNGESSTNGNTESNNTSRHASPSTARSKERSSASPDLSVFWMKDETMPSEAPSGVSLEPYVGLRLKALSQRSQAATGTCPYDLEVLYQFWCHFLIRNFNSRMYHEFKHYATEDGKERHNTTGMQNLVKFYAQALLSHNPIRDRLVRDYAELVNTEPAKLEGTAFKTLRSAWRNGALNLKNRKKLADIVDDALKERLES